MISQSRYVNIVSGVGAGAGVQVRSLSMRVITQNTLLPAGVIAEFSGSQMAASVASYFGSQSEEAARAAAYASFISKSISAPSMISFARWVNSAIAPGVVGDTTTKNLAALQAVSGGTLSINSDGTVQHITAINLTTATNLTQVASLIQTAIRTSTDSQLASASVTYNTNTNQFVLTGSVTGSGTLSVVLGGSPPLGTDAAALLGWGTTGAVNVAGQAAQTAAQAVEATTAISNNFGSFVFATPATALVLADYEAIATWNDSQNNTYLYSCAITLANLSTISAGVIGFSGTCLNLLSSTLPNDYVEQSPCEILAATNYNNTTGSNVSQNYMFYQFPNRNVTVSDDTTANTVDALRCNYIGQTQTEGTSVAFYQRGVLCGNPSTDAVDITQYNNEMWLKSSIISAIFTFFLATPEVAADAIGASQTSGVLQQAINQAKTNGVIVAGKTLDVTQQAFISTQTGDVNAWRQVQTIGYWYTVTFASQVNSVNGLTEWYASYILIYASSQGIRSVQGQDILM
jgi:hypothetical protein